MFTLPTPPVQQNCHSDNFLDQLRAFPPPFGQSPLGLPITQDFCLEKLTRNNGPFLDTCCFARLPRSLGSITSCWSPFTRGGAKSLREAYSPWHKLQSRGWCDIFSFDSFTFKISLVIRRNSLYSLTYNLNDVAAENLVWNQVIP